MPQRSLDRRPSSDAGAALARWPPPARRGRPRKFGRPARAVTVTLPEDVLDRLSRVDADLSRAIVRLVEARVRTADGPAKPAELATFGRRAVILVTPVRGLKDLPGVELVPLVNGRALIALAGPVSVAELELMVADGLERAHLPQADRATLAAVGEILRDARRSAHLYIDEHKILILKPKRRRRG